MKPENIFRIIGYVMLLSICTMLYIFLHSQFYLIVLSIMLCAPVASLLMAYGLRKHIDVEIIGNAIAAEDAHKRELKPDSCVRQGEELFFCIRILNDSFFTCLDAKLYLEVSNTFFQTSGKRIVSVPVRAKKGYEFTLPLIPEVSGIVSVRIGKVTMKDMMGFFFLKKEVSSEAQIPVMPQLLSDIEYSKSDTEAGMTESEESSKKGNDFSDVQEIREYIPGDKLMNIHWKLSAKRDILMVKDRVSMSDRQLVIVPELCNTDMHLLNMVVAATYSVIYELINDKTNVRLLYWSKNRYDYEDVRIDYRDGLDRAFERMFYESTYEAGDEAYSHMANVHPELAAFMYVSADEGKLNISIRENG